MSLILIVEEDEILRRTLELILQREGYRVLNTAFGDVGVQLALQEKPDLMILAVTLPILNGFEVCRKVREKGMNIPIIVMSSVTEPDYDKKMTESGFTSSISKPFGMREFKEKVNHYLQ